MIMKRLVGGGDDWRIHINVMVVVPATTLTIYWVQKKMHGQKDYHQCNNQIEQLFGWASGY